LIALEFGASPVDAKFIGPAPTVDPQFQGRGFLFLVSPNQARLIPGAAVTAFLPLPGEPATGVTVPREAIIRFNGATWVYVQTGGETFERREVALESPGEAGWFVRGGFKPGDAVVTAGAQQMLSEELKGLGTD
jgi:multidrug efflux pump subunit AcrA (membrane-fusion protein)